MISTVFLQQKQYIDKLKEAEQDALFYVAQLRFVGEQLETILRKISVQRIIGTSSAEQIDYSDVTAYANVDDESSTTGTDMDGHKSHTEFISDEESDSDVSDHDSPIEAIGTTSSSPSLKRRSSRERNLQLKKRQALIKHLFDDAADEEEPAGFRADLSDDESTNKSDLHESDHEHDSEEDNDSDRDSENDDFSDVESQKDLEFINDESEEEGSFSEEEELSDCE